jgi:hypothetical protein
MKSRAVGQADCRDPLSFSPDILNGGQMAKGLALANPVVSRCGTEQ